ncbi:Phage-related protein [Moraxella lacunata]|uniref:Phage-related protein n=1 Tax=Moraxella lacunata TaxID=477 RepID=A0A378T607_MORLA|nr:Phage-related protein [Moraxella lacunata]
MPVWTAQFNLAKTVATGAFDFIKGYIGAWVASTKAILSAGLAVFTSVFNAGFALIKNAFTTAFNVIKALVRGDMDGVKQAISNGIKNAWNIVKSGVADIVGEFKGLGAKLKQVGMEAIQGLIEGIASKFDAVKRKVGEIANYIPSGMRKILDIHSPSRVMRELGAWAGEGFVLGVGDKGQGR